jgi:hypothetical protein
MFFNDNLVASRIMLHGLARANMRIQWSAVANLKQKSWFAFDLNQDAYSHFRKRKGYSTRIYIRNCLGQ